MNLCTLATLGLSIVSLNGLLNGEIKKAPFGSVDGQNVDIYTLTSSKGIEARITNYGGIVVSLKTPDKSGKMADIVQGFDDLKGYLQDEPYFGAVIGRYASIRIGKAHFHA